MNTRVSFGFWLAKRSHFLNLSLGLIASLGFLFPSHSISAAVLIHRYPFETNANDVVGSSHGVVMGGATFDGTGGLSLDGVNDCVRLPSGIISSLDEISVEAWVTWQRGATPYWQRVFDFGNSSGTRGNTYFFLTPATAYDMHALPDWMRATISTNDTIAEKPRLDRRSPMPTNAATHVAVTYSPTLGVTKLYLNGVAVAAGTAMIPLNQITDTNNWLGKSQFYSDPCFKGRFMEFRIYRGLLLDSEIAANYLAGPDVLDTPQGALVCTLLPGDVTASSTTLNALVQPNAIPTAVFFEYGRTTNYGMTTPLLVVGSGTNLLPVGSSITSLIPGAMYHFRCVATNATGTFYGGDTAFITSPQITGVAATTNGHFEVQFNARTGTVYFLQQTTNLTQNAWSSLTNASPTADGPISFVDTKATNFPIRYYRLMGRDW